MERECCCNQKEVQKAWRDGLIWHKLLENIFADKKLDMDNGIQGLGRNKYGLSMFKRKNQTARFINEKERIGNGTTTNRGLEPQILLGFV
ncbi:MAG: hypothetical protein ACFFC7_11945 [Candidatus Hermodarchaeota archaeon]